MKKITFLLCLLVSTVGFTQTNLEDFEGTPPSFTGNNGLGGSNVVADPLDAMNSVGEIISSSAGDPWQQADLIMQDNLMDLTTDLTIQVDVYSTQSFKMLVRVDDLIFNPAAPSATADNDYVAGSGWQTLTFTMNEQLDGQSIANGEYNRISFFPNWAGSGGNAPNPIWNNGQDFTVYVDNITAVAGQSLPIETCSDGIQNQDEEGIDCGGVCAPCPEPPSVAAPTPPARPTQDVFSIYSNAYTNDITGNITLDAGFCGFGASSEVLIAGDETIDFNPSGAVCLGWDWYNPDNIANPNGSVDLSSYDFLHFDVYVADANLFNGDGSPKALSFKFANFANEPDVVETSALEVLLRPNNVSPGFILTSGSWISVDLDLNNLPTGAPPAFLGSTIRGNIGQLVITAANIDNVWFDNIYFHRNTLGVEDFSSSNFKVFPNPSSNTWNVSSSAVVNSVAVYDILGKQVITLTPNTNEVAIDASSLNPGIYFAEISGVNGSKTVKLIKE
jgi:hypothetical protein